MKKLISLLTVFALPLATTGRLIPVVTYQQMFNQADLVLIGKPVSTRDTQEKGQLPGGPTSWRVVGLSTDINISLVLKGEREMKRCTIHHYRQARPDQLLDDGPHFISFSENGTNAFLMFLKRESDGRYAPVSGQEDPALFSILKIKAEAQ